MPNGLLRTLSHGFLPICPKRLVLPFSVAYHRRPRRGAKGQRQCAPRTHPRGTTSLLREAKFRGTPRASLPRDVGFAPIIRRVRLGLLTITGHPYPSEYCLQILKSSLIPLGLNRRREPGCLLGSAHAILQCAHLRAHFPSVAGVDIVWGGGGSPPQPPSPPMTITITIYPCD